MNKDVKLAVLKGSFGFWNYCSSLMSLREVAKKVNFAIDYITEYPENPLSSKMQREIDQKRVEDIADYIQSNEEFFFNSLVVAIHGGHLHTIEKDSTLVLHGNERLYALDGQHRLAGIKEVAKRVEEGKAEPELLEKFISIIIVAYKNNKDGHQKARRLFTVLNKKAVAVAKSDIIALDEDDAMAIITRRLIEKKPEKFGAIDGTKEAKILWNPNNNMPTGNTYSLTTIGNLYDILEILFSNGSASRKVKEKLRNERPPDEDLDILEGRAVCFFESLGKNFHEVGEFFSAKNPSRIEKIVKRNRNTIDGGTVLFRPDGLDSLTQVIVKLARYQKISIEAAIELCAKKLPTKLNEPPYEKVFWEKGVIIGGARPLMRDLLLHMLGFSKLNVDRLRERYRKKIGDGEAELPSLHK